MPPVDNTAEQWCSLDQIKPERSDGKYPVEDGRARSTLQYTSWSARPGEYVKSCGEPIINRPENCRPPLGRCRGEDWAVYANMEGNGQHMKQNLLDERHAPQHDLHKVCNLSAQLHPSMIMLHCTVHSKLAF
jgi:hypothetical protein